MNLGGLNKYATIEKPLAVADGTYGGQTITWVTFVTAWIDIQPLSGRELIGAQAEHAEISGKIFMHYIPGLSTDMRITYEGKHYNIEAIIDAGLNHESFQLLYSEGVKDA